MHEKNLFHVAFMCMILGILFLYVYVESVSIPISTSLDLIDVEEKVKIYGKITSMSLSDNVIYFTISGKKEINTKVVFFPEEKPFLKEGQIVEIEGITEEYKGKKQLIASKVTIQ